MRIACPYCGERSLDEFLYSGDATVKRPNFASPDDFASPNAAKEFVSYVYERANPPGQHRELWYHSAGCHAWLVVTRTVATHAITAVEIARDVALNEKTATKDTI
jgi:heterotetrameric sarcosine oxidase delta subunit